MISELTNPLSDSVRAQLRERSFRALAEGVEACGFVLPDDRLVEVPNTAADPAAGFEIAAEESARYLDEAIAVWHTHRDHPRFSPEDVAACKALGLPWVMHCGRDATIHWMDPSRDAGLLGRPWLWGLYDCYAIVADYYHQVLGVELRDYPRGEAGVWNDRSFRDFEDNWSNEGFVPIRDEPRNGDVLLFAIHNRNINHVGVLVDVGRNHFLHHGVDRRSELTVLAWDGFWGRQIRKIVRHKSQQ